MIILEGCDNAGKSTLALQLAEDLKIFHARSFKKPKSLQDILSHHRWLSECPAQVVTDRHPTISELVYGPIIRQNTLSCLTEAKRVASLQTTYLVYCRPPFHTMVSTLGQRKQMDGVLDRFHALSKAYDELMEILQPDFTYDFSNPHHYQELIDDYRIHASANL